MSRVEIGSFDDKETTRIYIARNIQEAEGIEELLTGTGIDYSIALEPYIGGMVFVSERTGAAFYVLSGQSEFCRKLLVDKGYSAGIIED